MNSKRVVLSTDQRKIILQRDKSLPEGIGFHYFDHLNTLNMREYPGCYVHDLSIEKIDPNNSDQDFILKAMAHQFDSLWEGRSEHHLLFYPGTFAPLHQGHLSCMNLVSRWGSPVLLPDRSPKKDLHNMSWGIISSLLYQTKNLIDPRFLLDHDKNPTYQWVKMLRKLYPSKNISLVMGWDSLKTIQNWISANDLLKSIDRIFFASRGETLQEREAITSTLEGKFKNLKIEHLGHHPFENLASSNMN